MELQDFRVDLLNRVNTRKSVDGIITSEAFSQEAADLLTAAQEVDSMDLLSFKGTGNKRQALAVNGFFHDEQDRSISLMVSQYSGADATPSLTYTEAMTALKALTQYLEEALTGDFLEGRDPAYKEYQLAQTLQQLAAHRDDASISRYRLYLVTDAQLSSRAKSMEAPDINGVPAEYHVWDIQRFHQVHESAQGREALKLELRDWGVEGIPSLRIADGAGDVTTYLAAVPGHLLASLYRVHGSRLLEGNVRSFLSTRGKINQGIRETIAKDPAHFLAYNNGISATAAAVRYDGHSITGITDLQIVNGGQTTASLFYATQANRPVPLDDVFVQMKLVVVSPQEAVEMVPRISRFANSQNAVREDDFFSNSPFHVKMEELSRKLLAPAKAGVNFQTRWYYERTRGQYLNERNRLQAMAQRRFDTEFPRSQLLTKTEAAKYAVAWEQQPHQVSAGAQKNFKAWAALVATKYASHPDAFNESYYKRLVGTAILFNAVRSAITKAPWYQPGYLANLTAYAIARLSYAIAQDSRASQFDLLRIWEQQAVGEAMLFDAVQLAKLAHDVLTSSERLVVNVTEWGKREAAWNRLKEMPYTLTDAFVSETLQKFGPTGKRVLTVNTRFDPSVPERTHVEQLGETTWRTVRNHLSKLGLIGPTEQRLLSAVIPDQGRVRDTETARKLLDLYVTAVNRGLDEIGLEGK